MLSCMNKFNFWISALLFAGLIGTISAEVSLKLTSYRVEGNEKETISQASLKPSEKLSVQVTGSQKLTLVFKVESENALKYAAIVASSPGNVYASTFDLSKQGSDYKLTLDLADEKTWNHLENISGERSLTLYLANDQEKLSATLGSVTFDFKPLPATQGWDVFEALPEIQHVFRPDPKEPNPALPTLFVGLTLAPWGFLLIAWASLGANIKNLFASPSVTLWGLLFLVSLASELYLLYLYWTVLNLFQLLGYGTVLSVVTAILGRQALVSRAVFRLKRK